MSDDLVKRLRAEIFDVMGPNGATYSEEPVVFYEEAAAALVAKDAENARLRAALTSVADYMPEETDHPLMVIVRMAGLARAALNTQHKGETP